MPEWVQGGEYAICANIECYVQTRHAEYHTGLPLLRASGGDTGGGGEALVVMSDTNSESIEMMVVGSSNSKASVASDGTVPTLLGIRGAHQDVPILCYRPVCVMATSHWNAPFTDGDVSPTICARAGTGGNQLPLVALRRCDD